MNVARVTRSVAEQCAFALLLIPPLIFMGCQGAQRPSQGPASVATQPASQEPSQINVEGPYTHPGLKMRFPERIGDFERGKVLRYDQSEEDVSVGYNLLSPRYPVVATVYVYPGVRVVSIGSLPKVVAQAKALIEEREFSAVKNEILKWYPGATSVTEDEALLDQPGRTLKGRKLTFKFERVVAGTRLPMLSETYLFTLDKWFIKYRFTYPEQSHDLATAQIREFMTSLQWPEEL
ncbi:MAG: hypothetical protein M1136_11940 [Chloroflexi bacterium]|nr:hypothetical protein [Chloroflexota bacterium]